MDIISFLLGIVVLFKGEFRVGDRFIARPRARIIALTLMLPAVTGICLGFILVPNAMRVTESGQILLDADAFESLVNSLSTIQLLVFAFVIGAVLYQIFSVPPSSSQVSDSPMRSDPTARRSMFGESGSRFHPLEERPITPPPTVPEIMTVQEAAAYLGVTEAEVLALIDAGKLAAARSPSGYRIARIAIDDYLAEGRQGDY